MVAVATGERGRGDGVMPEAAGAAGGALQTGPACAGGQPKGAGGCGENGGSGSVIPRSTPTDGDRGKDGARAARASMPGGILRGAGGPGGAGGCVRSGSPYRRRRRQWGRSKRRQHSSRTDGEDGKDRSAGRRITSTRYTHWRSRLRRRRWRRGLPDQRHDCRAGRRRGRRRGWLKGRHRRHSGRGVRWSGAEGGEHRPVARGLAAPVATAAAARWFSALQVGWLPTRHNFHFGRRRFRARRNHAAHRRQLRLQPSWLDRVPLIHLARPIPYVDSLSCGRLRCRRRLSWRRRVDSGASKHFHPLAAPSLR